MNQAARTIFSIALLACFIGTACAGANQPSPIQAEWPFQTNGELFDLDHEPESATDRSHEVLDTVFPFPTLARDDPRFTPAVGYWRGPVWIGQAVFATEGLERYGFTHEAVAMRDKLLKDAIGLAQTEPFRETYDPLIGKGQDSRNFGWSAAEYFLMLHELDEPRYSDGV